MGITSITYYGVNQNHEIIFCNCCHKIISEKYEVISEREISKENKYTCHKKINKESS